jgi:hypothetical protein
VHLASATQTHASIILESKVGAKAQTCSSCSSKANSNINKRQQQQQNQQQASITAAT